MLMDDKPLNKYINFKLCTIFYVVNYRSMSNIMSMD